MSAPPIGPVIASPAQGSTPGAAQGMGVDPSAAGAFEALLAGLFGSQVEVVAEVGAEVEATDAQAAPGDGEDDDALDSLVDGDLVPANMQNLAALLIASQQQARAPVAAASSPSGEAVAVAIDAGQSAAPGLVAFGDEIAPGQDGQEIEAPSVADAAVDAKAQAALASLDDLSAPPAELPTLAQPLKAPRTPTPLDVAPTPRPEVPVADEASAPVQATAESPIEAAPETAEAAAPRPHALAKGADAETSHGLAAPAERAATTQIQAAVAPVASPSPGDGQTDRNPGDRPSEDDLAAAAGADAETSAAETTDGVAQSVATSDIAGAERPRFNAAAVVRGAPETVANLAAEILRKLDGRSTRFDVQLDPAGMGRVDVRVEIGAHGHLTAALSFDNPQSASELRSRSSELQKALEQAGFDTSGGLSFDFTGDRNPSGQSLANSQQDDGGSGGAWRGRAFQAALDIAGEATDTALNSQLYMQRRAESGLDIRI